MAIYIVAYDLHVSGQQYDCICEKLESFSTHWHAQGSVWIVESSLSAIELTEHLTPCLDENDKILVIKASGEVAWQGYSDNVENWIRQVFARS